MTRLRLLSHSGRSGVAALCLAALLAGGAPARGGLHYSAEQFAELPSQWRGFLTDLRTLRNIGVKPGPGLPPSPLRQQYEEAAEKLRAAAKSRPLTADEQADLGAILLRLGEVEPALEVLRAAQREHPRHFGVLANLGTAWQLYGNLEQAGEWLRQAARLAPARWQKAEELHLRLVRLRLRQARDAQELDDLFGVRFVGEKGDFEPGGLAAAERRKLPADAVAVTQQLALWLPQDPRLLWQLGELANAQGDVQTAADLFETCVNQFGLSAPALRERRIAAREAAAALAKRQPPGSDAAKAEHAGHAAAARSKRPLVLKGLEVGKLPPVTKTGVNTVPWPLLYETSLDRRFRPTFNKYLKDLDGLQVSLIGFMQPLTDELECNALMLIEYPTGCWYCEMPEVTGIVLVELPEGQRVGYTRNPVRVTGTLSLNATDPENFLYTIKNAKVAEPD